MRKTKALFVIAALSAMMFMLLSYREDIGRAQATVKTWGKGSVVAYSEKEQGK